MKKKFNNIFHNFQTCIHGLCPKWYHPSGKYAFQFLFGDKFLSFKNIFDYNIDQLKKQLDKAELHECDSKTCLASAHYNTESLKKTILSYLNSIDERIDERACHEEELQIKEQNVKERRNEGKSSSPGNDTDAEGAKISKNGSDDDITIAKSSHDKDKTEVQWSNNGLFENDHELEKTNENNKALKEANDLLTKELKTAYELCDENVQLHVFDSEETLEDAEKSRLKMKEFQKDEKVQELKIKSIDYTKLNNLYETFVSQVELSLEQKYFS
ncbi:hypothetical protein Tco_0471986 [Tanacetum coccineum]